MVERIRRPLVLLALVVAMGSTLVVALRDASASGPTPQLPDVVADSPDNVSLAISSETPTKEPDEAKLLLRFNGYVHNVGPGALDFRGSRATPDLGEPASPPMKVFQRVYNSDGSYTEEPSNAQMAYVDADGHHHWHLQRVAYYSLWSAQKSAEVAPAQKVGFCLEDSEHVEATGPSEPVYSDSEEAPFGSREFCREHQPEATDVYEGISAGWRDSYKSNLAFQWVDVSNVIPGEYWLRAEADPEHLIQQSNGEKPPAYATSPTVIPGFDAQAQSLNVEVDHPLTVTLTAQKWEGINPDEKPSAAPSYTVVTPPAHGTLGAISLGKVQYTPASGYSGSDSFTFSASDPGSSFPHSPAVATVSIDVSNSPLVPSVAIEGAPVSMIEGTSVQLSARVGNDTPLVTWSASNGSIVATGSSTAAYTAPPAAQAGYLATVTAESPGGGRDERTIVIVPAAPAQPKPEAPPPPTPGLHSPASAAPKAFSGPLSPPGAMLIGRKLYMTAVARDAGRLRLTALLRGRRIASCVAQVRARQSFTCTATLPRGVSVRAPIGVWATLRLANHRLHQTVRHPAPVPPSMKARTASVLHGVNWRGVKQAWRFFCGM
jgi:hypothetical protein